MRWAQRTPEFVLSRPAALQPPQPRMRPLASRLISMLRVTKCLSGFVLAFHKISPERFTEFIESVAPLQPVPLETLVDRNKAGKSTAGLFAITVDDSLAENSKGLIKAAQARGWPVTFYVPTAYVDSDDRMPFQWWFQLAPFLPNKVFRLKSGVLDFSTPGAVTQLTEKMKDLWYTHRIPSYLPLTLELRDALIRHYGVPRESLTPPPVLSWSEITQFSRNDLCRFESHGVSHSALSALSEDEMEFELKQSQSLLSERTGRECRHFAYPFGNPQSIGNLSPTFASQHYDSAVTMALGGVDGCNSWLLPRIPLYPENSSGFAHLKILLKCTPLNLTGRYKNKRRRL